MLAACGRQVTPDRAGTNPSSGGLSSGDMSVKFSVAAPFNFQKYSYAIVFNTSGDGVTPRADGTTNNYQGYSFVIIVGNGASGVGATAYAFVRGNNIASQPPTLLAINAVGQQLVLDSINSNGQGTQFSLHFARLIASAYVTPSPSPSASPSVAPTATSSPTAAPSSSASPSASPTPTPTPIPGIASVWQYNFFVVSGSPGPGSTLSLVDSLGSAGAADNTYVNPFPLDTSTAFDYIINALTPIGAPEGSALIVGGEIASAP